MCQTCRSFGRRAIFKQGCLGAARGGWEGPSIDQGWHLTRSLAPSGSWVMPCNGEPPDNETWIGEFVWLDPKQHFAPIYVEAPWRIGYQSMALVFIRKGWGLIASLLHFHFFISKKSSYTRFGYNLAQGYILKLLPSLYPNRTSRSWFF